MQVRDVMTSGAKWIAPTASIADAAKMMRELDIGSVPVEQEDRVAGMLTDRDITCRVIAQGRDPKATKVADVMSKNIISCTDAETIENAAKLMEKNQIRRLPVLDAQRKLVGMVTVGDIAERSTRTLAGDVMYEVCKPNAGARAAQA